MNVMGGVGTFKAARVTTLFYKVSMSIEAEQFQVIFGSSMEQTGAISPKLRISNLWEPTP